MNNYAEININGKPQGLLFGMFAMEEFNRIQLERNNLEGELRISPGLFLADAICAAAYNYSVIKRVKSPDYSVIIEAVCDMYGDDEKLPELEALSKVYSESRFGQALDKQTEALKKKFPEALESQSQPIGGDLGSSLTES